MKQDVGCVVLSDVEDTGGSLDSLYLSEGSGEDTQPRLGAYGAYLRSLMSTQSWGGVFPPVDSKWCPSRTTTCVRRDEGSRGWCCSEAFNLGRYRPICSLRLGITCVISRLMLPNPEMPCGNGMARASTGSRETRRDMVKRTGRRSLRFNTK